MTPMHPLDAIQTKTEPWAHQRAAFEAARGRPGFGLWLDMGTGKSKVAIDLFINSDCRRVLILAPKSVLTVWPEQFERHAAEPVAALVLGKGSTTARAALMERWLPARASRTAVVVNYEAFYADRFFAAIGRVGFDFIVADEAHRIKMPSGQASRKLAQLGKRSHVKHRLGLSGTPLPHSPLDAYAIYRFLDPTIFGWSFQRFKARYGIPGGFQGRQIIAYQNTDEFREKFNSISFRVSADDVLDLPETLDVWRWCELEPAARKVYDDLERHLMAEIETGEITASNALVKLLRLQQITSGVVREDSLDPTQPGTMRRVSHEKKALLVGLFEDLPPTEPIVVFGRFRSDLEDAREMAGKMDREHYELSGSANELEGWKDAIRRRGAGTVLAVQIQAGGVGVDLSAARYAVYYSTGFSLGDYLQSRKRLHRPGQRRSVVYYHLGAKNTVDLVISRALAKRENLIESVVSGMGEA